MTVESSTQSRSRLCDVADNQRAAEQCVGTDEASWCARFAGRRWSLASPLNAVLNGPEMVNSLDPDPPPRLVCRECNHAADLTSQLRLELSRRLRVSSSLVVKALIERKRGLKCSCCNGRQFFIEFLGDGFSAPVRPIVPRPGGIARMPSKTCRNCGRTIAGNVRPTLWGCSGCPQYVGAGPSVGSQGAPPVGSKICRNCGRTIAGNVRRTSRGCSVCRRYDGVRS